MTLAKPTGRLKWIGNLNDEEKLERDTWESMNMMRAMIPLRLFGGCLDIIQKHSLFRMTI